MQAVHTHPPDNENRLKGTGHTAELQGVTVDGLQRHTADLASQVKQKELPSGSSVHPTDYAGLLKLAEVKHDDQIEKPPTCLSIKSDDQESTFGTLGNFSLIIGKAKSRKTFFVSSCVAAVMAHRVALGCIQGSLPENKRITLFFDTEQGRFHVRRIVRRIHAICDSESLPNLKVYALRPFATTQRLDVIRYAIENTPDLGLVVIDGIRDTVFDINDPMEATERATDLLRWTEEKGIHLITVLHENKGNANARGHLGSELVNKAETVISVTRDANNREISIVTPEMCRDQEFEPFAFRIDDNGLPCLAEDWQAQSGGTSRKPRERGADMDTWSNQVHRAILQRMFRDTKPAGYEQTWRRLIEASQHHGYTIGQNAAKQMLTAYQSRGLIAKKDSKPFAVYEGLLTQLDTSLPV